jgi:hypothetical protein
VQFKQAILPHPARHQDTAPAMPQKADPLKRPDHFAHHQSSASTTPSDVLPQPREEDSPDHVMDETPEPMSGTVLRSKGETLPRVIRLDRNHNREETVCDADEDAIDGDHTESPVQVRCTSQVVDSSREEGQSVEHGQQHRGEANRGDGCRWLLQLT